MASTGACMGIAVGENPVRGEHTFWPPCPGLDTLVDYTHTYTHTRSTALFPGLPR